MLAHLSSSLNLTRMMRLLSSAHPIALRNSNAKRWNEEKINLMNPYIVDTKYCTNELIKLIFEEETTYNSICTKRNEMLAKTGFYYEEFISKEYHEDFNDFQVMHDFHKMAEAQKQANELQIEINKIGISIEIKEYSLCALCGALLQIAKQGISIVHKELNICPNGRNIKTETLKNIIWQGRNQSLHFEEGKYNIHVTKCFANLKNDFGDYYLLDVDYPKNLARHIVKLLEWNTYSKYEADMILLLG